MTPPSPGEWLARLAHFGVKPKQGVHCGGDVFHPNRLIVALENAGRIANALADNDDLALGFTLSPDLFALGRPEETQIFRRNVPARSDQLSVSWTADDGRDLC